MSQSVDTKTSTLLSLLATLEGDLFYPIPIYKNGRLYGKQNGMGVVWAWLHEGWGLLDEPSPEQIAAALLMEANTQDDCVRGGGSEASYPIRLRRIAFSILRHFHEEPK